MIRGDADGGVAQQPGVVDGDGAAGCCGCGFGFIVGFDGGAACGGCGGVGGACCVVGALPGGGGGIRAAQCAVELLHGGVTRGGTGGVHAVIVRAFALFKPDAVVPRFVGGGVAVYAGAGGLADAVAQVDDVREDGGGNLDLLVDGDVEGHG